MPWKQDSSLGRQWPRSETTYGVANVRERRGLAVDRAVALRELVYNELHLLLIDVGVEAVPRSGESGDGEERQCANGTKQAGC